MDQIITLSISDLLLWVLMFCAIIAIIVLIVLLSKVSKSINSLNDTLKKVDGIADDVKVITTAAKKSTEEAETMILKASRSVNNLCSIVDSNKGPITALTGLVNAGASLASLITPKKKHKS